MALEPGPFGPFVLLEPLGRGGMGEVWLARPRSQIPGASDLCVVKTMRADVADDHDAVKRFGDEARLALLLAHPRISRVLDAGRISGMRYMAIELVEGVDIITMMRRCAEQNTAFDEGVALWIAACVLDALSFAHEARHPVSQAPLGIVHRDISPQNIICDAKGFAHVIDFGLALSTLKRAKTAQDVVMGKIGYMAPEQARGVQVDVRCDLYAAGVVFYELLVHEPYWGEMEPREIWQHVARFEYQPPRLGFLKPDVARWLGPLLERDVDKRCASAAERRNALGALLNVRGGGPAAQKRLAALVEKVAFVELERVRRLRKAAVSLPPVVDDLAPDESIARAEAEAIKAALASKTEMLPSFNQPGDVRDTVLLPAVDVIAPKMNTAPPSPGTPVVKRQVTTVREGPVLPPEKNNTLLFVAAGAVLAVVVVAAVAWVLFK